LITKECRFSFYFIELLTALVSIFLAISWSRTTLTEQETKALRRNNMNIYGHIYIY